MNKELEEAIKVLNRFKSIKILYGNTFAMHLEDLEQLQQAIETVLNYIDNSIPKEVIEKKIEEINKDLTENESYTTHWEITRNKYFEQQGKKAGFKELLEGK